MKTGLSRTSIFAIVGAVALVALVVVAVTSAVKKVQRNRQALNEFNAASEEIGQGLREKIGNEDTVAGATDKAQQIQEAMGKAANKLTGDAAKAFRAGERLMGAMRTKVAQYEAAYSGFVAKGGMDPKSLTSEQAITERMALLQTFEGTNNEFRDFLKDAETTYRQELNKEGYPATQMNETAQGFSEGGNIDTLLAIRATDSELCVAMLKSLQLLQTEWGKWKVNEDGAMIFQNDSSATEFNGYAKQLQDVGDRQTSLQEKILRGRQRGAGGKQSVIGTQ